ncbi:hypothetical protein HW115_06830 [Verrucomicrobiaceae bacterium N1E253]|uniref:Uncharacterized protein n=1 Tax=Oceaniferula marina TaxID=2748318 RepID=A0A851GC55_9BACT|nr:hypothetical protein [Oceaniferula marina]NWK55318.1 hypothetical protein [Oceaniferula marina]
MKRWKLASVVMFGLMSLGVSEWTRAKEQEVRTWTSTKGSTLDGTFVRLVKDQVEIQPEIGKRLKVDLKRLSPKDRQHALEAHFQTVHSVLAYRGARVGGGHWQDARVTGDRPMAMFSLVSGFSLESKQARAPRGEAGFSAADWHEELEKLVDAERDKPAQCYLMFDPVGLYKADAKAMAEINHQINKHEMWARKEGVDLIMIDPIRPNKEVKYYEKGIKKSRVGGFTVEVPETIEHVRTVEDCQKLMDEWIKKHERRWKMVPLQAIHQKASQRAELLPCFAGRNQELPDQLLDAVLFAKVFKLPPPLQEYKAFQSKGKQTTSADPLLQLSDDQLSALSRIIDDEVNGP